jgi:hypothetical protein
MATAIRLAIRVRRWILVISRDGMISRSHTGKKVANLGSPAILLALSTGTAPAQVYPREVVSHCAHIVEKMPKLRGRRQDVYRDRMRYACDANGGRVSGLRTFFDTNPGTRAQLRQIGTKRGCRLEFALATRRIKNDHRSCRGV